MIRFPGENAELPHRYIAQETGECVGNGMRNGSSGQGTTGPGIEVNKLRLRRVDVRRSRFASGNENHGTLLQSAEKSV